MLASGQSLTRGVGVCVKTIVLPSGDQSKSWSLKLPPTWKSPLVNWRGARFPSASFSIGTTHSRFILRFSSTTFASFFSFLAFSSASVGGSGITKAIHWPSGDQRKPPASDFRSVSCSASPPSARISQRLFFSVRREANAIQCPLGDHCGLLQDFSP